MKLSETLGTVNLHHRITFGTSGMGRCQLAFVPYSPENFPENFPSNFLVFFPLKKSESPVIGMLLPRTSFWAGK